MAFGLFLGALGLGLQGTRKARDSYEDYSRSKELIFNEKFDGYVYYDHNLNMHDANTGHKFIFTKVRMVDGEYLNRHLIGYPVGDEVAFDIETDKVIKNVSEIRRKKIDEKIKKKNKSLDDKFRRIDAEIGKDYDEWCREYREKQRKIKEERRRMLE